MELRVFLVEDSGSARTLLQELLDSVGGLRVLACAGSQAEATDWLERHANGWDLAVVDLVLDEGSGFAVVRLARQLSPHGRIVVFSGYVTPALREYCLRIGADAVIDKHDPDALARWLARARAEYGPAPGSPTEK
jgi:two-component system, OmpR family, response regulator